MTNEVWPLLAMTAALTFLGLIASGFIAAEVVFIMREVLTQAVDWLRRPKSEPPQPVRQVIPYRDRETVERLIDHLEEEEKE